MSPEERAVVVAEIELSEAHKRLRGARSVCPTLDEPGVRQRIAIISSSACALRYRRDMCDPATLIDEVESSLTLDIASGAARLGS